MKQKSNQIKICFPSAIMEYNLLTKTLNWNIGSTSIQHKKQCLTYYRYS